ncbi:TPA: hypothetical protein ACH3X2_004215 [Trebouxia sp. C0005]
MIRTADAVLAAAAVCGSVVLWRYFRREESEDSYEDLTGPVSFSSRMVAAYRAVESREKDALFQDPMAEGLAGEQAIQQAENELAGKTDSATHSHTDGLQMQSGPGVRKQSDSKRQYCVTRFALRTKLIDDQILAALSDSKVSESQPEAVRQVVVLGAGMDTRAWRMDLPEGVKWFEIDMKDVVAAKNIGLQRAGAQTAPDQQDCQFPLKAASFRNFSADLNRRYWIEMLIAAGWSNKAPTLWLAEGLLMYLTQKSSEHLLQDMADHSRKGSVLLTQLFRESAREANQEYYGTVSNKHLKALKTTFTSFVPDNYQQVGLVNTADDVAYKAECPCCIGHQADAIIMLGVTSVNKLQVVLVARLQPACSALLSIHMHFAFTWDAAKRLHPSMP